MITWTWVNMTAFGVFMLRAWRNLHSLLRLSAAPKISLHFHRQFSSPWLDKVGCELTGKNKLHSTSEKEHPAVNNCKHGLLFLFLWHKPNSKSGWKHSKWRPSMEMDIIRPMSTEYLWGDVKMTCEMSTCGSCPVWSLHKMVASFYFNCATWSSSEDFSSMSGSEALKVDE